MRNVTTRILDHEPVPAGWRVVRYDICTTEVIIAPSMWAVPIKADRFARWAAIWLTKSFAHHVRAWWKVRPRWGR